MCIRDRGNTITRTTADAFNQIIADMESFAELAENTMEKANSQAAVSYTHLDVYKRQEQLASLGSLSGAFNVVEQPF